MNSELLITLIFAAIAVAVIVKLRSVLGRRIGHQEQHDPFAARREAEAAKASAKKSTPGAPDAIPATPLEAGIEQIRLADRSFNPDEFVSGAKEAFRAIVAAFAEGDREMLKMLLGREVYDSFDGAIAEREAAGETLKSEIVSLDNAELIEAQLVGREAQVTVRFRSHQVHTLLDKDGKKIEDEIGTEEKSAEVVDIWTFARDTASNDPNWQLVETESPED